MSQKWYELYMRAKSYRKALAWQKKYLAVVIQGYTDLLGVSGAAFEHPDLLQKEVPITPSSVGLCDKRKGKTRFRCVQFKLLLITSCVIPVGQLYYFSRIVGKAVLASVRMKYMVNRWTGKMCPRSMPDIQRRVGYAGSSRNASASSSSSSESDGSEMNNRRNNCDKPRTVTFSAFSPPTKDSSKTSRSAPSRSTNTGVSVVRRYSICTCMQRATKSVGFMTFRVETNVVRPVERIKLGIRLLLISQQETQQHLLQDPPIVITLKRK